MSRHSSYRHRQDDSYRIEIGRDDERYGNVHRRSFNGGQSDSYRREEDVGGNGNLLVTNFGPSTTIEDIQALFAPFVEVDEVVMRCNRNGQYAEVNTHDPKGSQRAMAAMHVKAMLGGKPIFISRGGTATTQRTQNKPSGIDSHSRRENYEDRRRGDRDRGVDDFHHRGDRNYGSNYYDRRERPRADMYHRRGSFHREDSYSLGDSSQGENGKRNGDRNYREYGNESGSDSSVRSYGRRRYRSSGSCASYDDQDSYKERRGGGSDREDGKDYYRDNQRYGNENRGHHHYNNERRTQLSPKDMLDDGNLHITHFGPATTRADIEELFAPYVKVDEVVMRSNERGDYAFVNTRDPVKAQIASRALSGKAMLDGMPVWISRATRKGDNPSASGHSYSDRRVGSYQQHGGNRDGGDGRRYGNDYGNSGGSDYGISHSGSTGGGRHDARGEVIPPVSEQELHRQGAGNLHISHFGPRTTEEDIEDLFAPFVRVDRVVMRSNERGTFAFVDTSDPDNAQRAKDALSGRAMLDGMAVWITWCDQATRKNPALASGVSTQKKSHSEPCRGLHPKGAGNLHMVNFGPSTTREDIETLFSEYVKVDKVVIRSCEKGPYAFIDTSDPPNAQRAKEALSGKAILDGKTVWISWAGRPTQNKPPPLVGAGNLHISHFGPATTEEDIERLFAPYVKVDEVVMKSNERGEFAFVNTSDPVNAQIAREALNGKAKLNGMVVWVSPYSQKNLPSSSTIMSSDGGCLMGEKRDFESLDPGEESARRKVDSDGGFSGKKRDAEIAPGHGSPRKKQDVAGEGCERKRDDDAHLRDDDSHAHGDREGFGKKRDAESPYVGGEESSSEKIGGEESSCQKIGGEEIVSKTTQKNGEHRDSEFCGLGEEKSFCEKTGGEEFVSETRHDNGESRSAESCGLGEEEASSASSAKTGGDEIVSKTVQNNGEYRDAESCGLADAESFNAKTGGEECASKTTHSKGEHFEKELDTDSSPPGDEFSSEKTRSEGDHVEMHDDDDAHLREEHSSSEKTIINDSGKIRNACSPPPEPVCSRVKTESDGEEKGDVDTRPMGDSSTETEHSSDGDMTPGGDSSTETENSG